MVLIGLGLLAGAIAGQERDPALAPPVQAPLSGPSAPAAAGAETAPHSGRLRMVYVPFNGKDGTITRFAPLTQKLAELVGAEIDAICFETYDEVYQVLGADAFEIAFLTPLTYTEAYGKARLEVVAQELYGPNKKAYHSLIIAKAESSVPDDKVTLAFTSEHSTSGYLVPLLYFKYVVRIPPEQYADEVVFAGAHNNVIAGVLEGKYDLGATSDVDVERAIASGLVPKNAFEYFWKSDPIPGAPICLRPDLPGPLKQKIQAALAAIGQDREIMKAISLAGVGPTSAEPYEAMFKIKQMLDAK